MRFVIVTGMSGAGKSQALKIFEDFGYYCVDNLPMELLISFARLAGSGKAGMEKVALVTDVRNGDSFLLLEHILESEEFLHIPYEILYLDASDECLIKRFKETRRSHPLEAQQGSLEAGIKRERALLGFIRSQAAYVIDTSFLLTRDLRKELHSIFIQEQEYKNLNITILSFGFKYGIPTEADLVFDVRFLPNPFYVPELMGKSGLEKDVADYVLSSEQANRFMEKLLDLIDFLLPNYEEEGKTSLTICIGCTGGRHRSVAVTESLAKYLADKGHETECIHRDIDKV